MIENIESITNKTLKVSDGVLPVCLSIDFSSKSDFGAKPRKVKKSRG